MPSVTLTAVMASGHKHAMVHSFTYERMSDALLEIGSNSIFYAYIKIIKSMDQLCEVQSRKSVRGCECNR